MGALLDTEPVEQWMLSCRGSGGRSCGRTGRDFNQPPKNALSQRGPLSKGCYLGDGAC